MAPPNVVILPGKPRNVTDAMWWFVSACMGYLPGTQNSGTYGDWKPGSHASRDVLLAKPEWRNDYSIRDPLNKQGPGWAGAAWDWTFPTAHGKDYVLIMMVMQRIQRAYEQNDPRAKVFFEVLGQADPDQYAEGFVFYPTKRTRTPDASHLWHIHFGFVRAFLEVLVMFRAAFSLVRGLTYQQWLAEEEGSEDMADWDTITAIQVGITNAGFQELTAPNPTAKEAAKFSNKAVEERQNQRLAAIFAELGINRKAIVDGVTSSVLSGVKAMIDSLDLNLTPEQLAKITDAIIAAPDNPLTEEDAELVAEAVADKFADKLGAEA